MNAEQQKNLAIFSDAVDRYWKKVYRLCLFYLRDSGDAEDATQAVFEKVLKKSSQFRGQADPFTWIYRIAVNTALNMLRRKRIIGWLSLEKAGGADAGPEADPARRLEIDEAQRERLQRLRAGISRLTAREKTAFYLFHYEKLQQKAIAGIMKTSVTAVESLVHKATKKIRRGWQDSPAATVK